MSVHRGCALGDVSESTSVALSDAAGMVCY